MNDADQSLPRRIRSAARARRIAFSWKIPALAVALVVVVAAVATPLLLPLRAQPQDLTYTELVTAIDGGRVASLEIVAAGEVVRGRWVGSTAEPGRHDFRAVYPAALAESLVGQAGARNVEVTFHSRRTAETYRTTAMFVLQLLLFAGLGWFVYVQLRGQKGGDLGQEGPSDTTFDDVAGTQGAADDLREVVDFLRDPSAFAALGARVPKGVLLVGPPGTGKTLLARAVAGEAGVPFFQLSGSEVTGFIVGLGAQRIRGLFRKAATKGGVIFIDELDSLGGARGRNRAHNEDDRTLNQLLVEMDGFSPTSGVVVIGATNRPEDLDGALTRPGRFDRHVTAACRPRTGARPSCGCTPRGAVFRSAPTSTSRAWHGSRPARVAPSWPTC